MPRRMGKVLREALFLIQCAEVSAARNVRQQAAPRVWTQLSQRMPPVVVAEELHLQRIYMDKGRFRARRFRQDVR